MAIVGLFFVLPLALSFVLAFRAKDGSATLAHFAKSFDLYTTGYLFTLAITLGATVADGFGCFAFPAHCRKIPGLRRPANKFHPEIVAAVADRGRV